MTSWNGESHGVLADRLPPQNLDAERGVLGAILMNNEVLPEIIGILAVEDFYRDAHQVIYRAIRDLCDQGKPIDTVTLSDELTRRDQYKLIGGDEILLEICNSVPHAVNARYYTEIVREKSISRRTIQICTSVKGMDTRVCSRPSRF
jgi:replicative DNA helicase